MPLGRNSGGMISPGVGINMSFVFISIHSNNIIYDAISFVRIYVIFL